MIGTVELLFSLLRVTVCGAAPPDLSGVGETDLAAVFRLADAHAMAHLLGPALEAAGRAPTDPTLQASLLRAESEAVLRCERQTYMAGRLYAALETAGIDYLPLKGAVLRDLWPEPWMRTCGDLDVLVREDDLERAIAAAGTAGFVLSSRSTHDVCLSFANGEHTELHHALIEDFNGRAVSDVLARVWEAARPCGGSRRHEMPAEWSRLYHIAHAAKHFVHGGCGIRPSADLFLSDRADPAAAERTDLLAESGLSAFASALRDLTGVWWGGAPHSALTSDMETYLLGAGVYGSAKNRIAVLQNRTGTGFGYLWHRLFLPRALLATSYPVLNKHPILYPWYTVRRWCRGLFLRRRRVHSELQVARGISDEERARMRSLTERLGLS